MKYSGELMKRSDDLPQNPKILCWRGKVLIYMGNDILGKKHFLQSLSFDPDMKEC
jgi:hypothetical protein